MPITDYIIPILIGNNPSMERPKLLHIFLLIFKACACCRLCHVKVKAVETSYRRQDECETMKR
ncbi:hypothetical protein T07_9360 [Trichinella nelsoni]|uniref:Uncharacterized protein n=1 Tax=Trichinella nelsoni TaxID=6336 RepID=A0A0V0S4N8_9BILA|nr:hypothetical protein T07_9360 [Trichinella nelsoni]